MGTNGMESLVGRGIISAGMEYPSEKCRTQPNEESEMNISEIDCYKSEITELY